MTINAVPPVRSGDHRQVIPPEEQQMSRTISVIRGDGIGPEIMKATLRTLDSLDCGLEYEFVDAGLVALENQGELLPKETLASIRRNGIALKGPLTTPVGEGFRSLNVTLRKTFDLFANIRPVLSIPGTRARYENVDIITVRENTEGAYLAADARVSDDGSTAESKMVVSRKGCERVTRYAFELARSAGRRKVTLVHKANILKVVSGMFLDVSREVAGEYPDIECNEMIVDATCMKLVMDPQQFDVIVTTNLFGDIISDLCAGLVGGLGLAPGANIGEDAAMFEAVHGSAPDIAGQKIANPCALMLAGAQMLSHLAMEERAARLRSAIRETISAGDRVTPDLGGSGSTESFADAIIERL
jgi:isocitrate dehydrogenase (NAD+)